MEGDSKINSFVEKASQAQSPEGVIQVILDATEQEGLFVFGELLASPKVEQVNSPLSALHDPLKLMTFCQKLNSAEQYKKIYELLEIFAFGTYKDYLGFYYCFFLLFYAILTKNSTKKLFTTIKSSATKKITKIDSCECIC